MVPPRRPINIEDLLLHASGITYESNGKGLVKKAYAGVTVGDFNNAEFAERIARLPLAEQPRTLWEYGHSTDGLGRVIEVVSGQSLYEFEKAQLLGPLAMSTTKFFLTDPAERSRLAKPLRTERYNTRSSLDVTRWESGGSGMVSTIGDFSRFARMMLHGGVLDGHRFLKPETFKAMTTDHIGRARRCPKLLLLPRRRLRISAMGSVSAPTQARPFRRLRAPSAKSNGMAPAAPISWSTPSAICFLFCSRTHLCSAETSRGF